MTGGGLLPLGGEEQSGGYKGYGLMFMVEILCGILAGSRFGPNVRTWQTSSGEADLVNKLALNNLKLLKFVFKCIFEGQCFIAINPGNFADNFEDRLQSLMDHCRSMEPVIFFSNHLLVEFRIEKETIFSYFRLIRLSQF